MSIASDADNKSNPTNLSSSERMPEAGTALSLSGGGYRAMLFHVGVIWRLYELGELKNIKRISSVSGGSITAAKLGQVWDRLSFDPAKMSTDFIPLFVAPVRKMGSITIDANAIIGGMLLAGTIAEHVASQYEKYLFGKDTLRDLPDGSDKPRFVINATNVQSGALWRFSRPFMGDWRVGRVLQPKIRLSEAVAASSAFPPILSPMTLDLEPSQFTTDPGNDLTARKYRDKVVLSDGGVYDNLGIETTWKRYTRILVSDAGAKMAPENEPHSDWARHSYRVLDIVDNQVRSLRKRQIMSAFTATPREKDGAYWSIRTNLDPSAPRPGAASRLACPFGRTSELANIPTRLKGVDDTDQMSLINWGYAVTDAAMVSIGVPGPVAPKFPYGTSL